MGIFPALRTTMLVKQDGIQNLKFDVSSHHIPCIGDSGDMYNVVVEGRGLGGGRKEEKL